MAQQVRHRHVKSDIGASSSTIRNASPFTPRRSWLRLLIPLGAATAAAALGYKLLHCGTQCQAQKTLNDLLSTHSQDLEPVLAHLDALDDKLLRSSEVDQHQRAWLLRQALEARSQAGVQLAVANGAAAELEDAELLTQLEEVVKWCAPRSLRFRLQDMLIGRAGARWVTVLRAGDDDAQAAVADELLTRVPSLKRRGAASVHAFLRVHYRTSTEDEQLQREQLAVELLDAVVVHACTPFLSLLIEGAGSRGAGRRSHVEGGGGGSKGGDSKRAEYDAPLDASHLAALFASTSGGLPLVRAFAAHGYALDRPGAIGLFDRCLACAVCCLQDGVASMGNAKMPFSARHAAAAAGQLQTLAWLEAWGPPDSTVGTRLPARAMLFDAENVTRAAPSALEAAAVSSHGTGGWAADAGGQPLAEQTMALDDDAPRCDIHVVSGSEVAREPEAFVDRYIRSAQPVLVRGLLTADPALAPAATRMRRADLVSRLGPTMWEVGTIPYQGRYQGVGATASTLADFVREHIDGCAPGAVCHHYIFGEAFSRNGRPRTVQSERLLPLPTWAARARVQLARATQFYLGGPRSGAPMHYHQAAFNLLAYGRKRWLLVPPARALFSMQPAHEWMREEHREEQPRVEGMLECEQRAGDLLVMPDLWGHLTYNLETSVGVAQEFMY